MHELLRRVLAQLSEDDCVHVVVDEATKDRTLHRVEEYAHMDARVLPVYAPENRSVVDAYFRGYREALEGNHEWILEMDGGLSHLPEEIPRFTAAMAAGAEFAAGSRFVKDGRYVGVSTRRLISQGGTLLANAVLGTRMRDMTSGFECFTRDALAHVLECGVRSRAHFFQTEIRYLLHDWRWVEVPITYRTPSGSVGKDSLAEACSNLVRLRREGCPVRRTRQ